MLVMRLVFLGALLWTLFGGIRTAGFFPVGTPSPSSSDGKNAILIVNFARERYEAGEPLSMRSAKRLASRFFRPIIMTSMALLLLGVLPLVHLHSAGRSGGRKRHRHQSYMACSAGNAHGPPFSASGFVPVLRCWFTHAAGRRSRKDVTTPVES